MRLTIESTQPWRAAGVYGGRLTGEIDEPDAPMTMVSCPVCRSDNAALLGGVSSEAAAQHYILREEYPDRHVALRVLIENLWRSSHCELRQCDDCGFGFAWPYVAGDSEFYNLAYPTVGYPRTKWEYERTVQELRQVATDGMIALEIGSGFGFFLDKVCPRFVAPDRVVAVEYNEKCRDLLKAKGYRTMAVDVRQDDFSRFKSQFDLVFMFQVLEHMDGLDALMDRLRLLAAPGCHIFIAVPNARRIAFNEQNGGLLDMPPNHIGRWTPRAFEAIAARFGLSMVASDLEPVRPTAFLKADLCYAYLRKAQVRGSRANRLRSMPRSRWRTLREIAAIVGYAPTRLAAWRAGWAQPRELGELLWVHLRRA